MIGLSWIASARARLIIDRPRLARVNGLSLSQSWFPLGLRHRLGWNEGDQQIFVHALKGAEDKRLMYNQPRQAANA
jgi:hypothetical protein